MGVRATVVAALTVGLLAGACSDEGGLGQSSDADGPSYDPDGLLLEDGLVEVVTEDSRVAGQRHENLADHVGEVASFAWLGEPVGTENDVAGVGWIRAVEWVAYQRSRS